MTLKSEFLHKQFANIRSAMVDAASSVAGLPPSAYRDPSCLDRVKSKLNAATTATRKLSNSAERKALMSVLGKLNNATVSLQDGLSDFMVERSDVREFQKEYALNHSTALDALAAFKSKRNEREEETASQFKALDDVQKLEQKTQKDRGTLTRFSAFSSKLPTTSRVKRFELLSLPVILTFDPPLFDIARRLDRVGFDVDTVDSYPIVHDQVVLAINRVWANKQGGDHEALVDEIIETLRVKSHSKYLSLGEFGNRATPQFTYFLLMKDTDIAHITSAAKGSSIDEIGFPF